MTQNRKHSKFSNRIHEPVLRFVWKLVTPKLCKQLSSVLIFATLRIRMVCRLIPLHFAPWFVLLPFFLNAMVWLVFFQDGKWDKQPRCFWATRKCWQNWMPKGPKTAQSRCSPWWRWWRGSFCRPQNMFARLNRAVWNQFEPQVSRASLNAWLLGLQWVRTTQDSCFQSLCAAFWLFVASPFWQNGLVWDKSTWQRNWTFGLCRKEWLFLLSLRAGVVFFWFNVYVEPADWGLKQQANLKTQVCFQIVQCKNCNGLWFIWKKKQHTGVTSLASKGRSAWPKQFTCNTKSWGNQVKQQDLMSWQGGTTGTPLCNTAGLG